MKNADTPYQRARQYGVNGAQLIDLLALAVTREEDESQENFDTARRWVKEYGVGQIHTISLNELRERAGLEDFEATRLLAAIEIGRQVERENRRPPGPAVTSAQEAYEALRWLEDETQEHFCVALLDAKGRLFRSDVLHIGTLTSSPVGPREVFRLAVRENAASVILAHNHPSGDPTPSPEDIAITAELRRLGEALDVIVLDHLIIGHGTFVSLSQLGKL